MRMRTTNMLEHYIARKPAIKIKTTLSAFFLAVEHIKTCLKPNRAYILLPVAFEFRHHHDTRNHRNYRHSALVQSF